MYDLETEVKPLTPQFLPEVEALLAASGQDFTRVDGALRCELKAFESIYAVVYIVSAENFFIHGTPVKDAYNDFRRRQAELLEAERNNLPRKDPYLFVVGNDEIMFHPDFLDLRWTLEHDDRVAKKAILSISELPAWLRSPFPLLTGAARANDKPVFTEMRDLDYQAEQPSVANYVFEPRNILDTVEKDFLTASSAEMELVNAVYQRVMGSTHRVFYDEDGIGLGHVGDEDGIPLPFCSAGESLILAFSVFMARAAGAVFPGMCLGIHGGFNMMDTLRRYSATDCVREFVISTGASVVVQSNKSEVTRFAQNRLVPVMEAAAKVAASNAI
jgi:hypothetical protein